MVPDTSATATGLNLARPACHWQKRGVLILFTLLDTHGEIVPGDLNVTSVQSELTEISPFPSFNLFFEDLFYQNRKF